MEGTQQDTFSIVDGDPLSATVECRRRMEMHREGWSARVETADQFAVALDQALGRGGIRLLHCVSDIERLNAAGATVSGLRAKG